VPYFDRAYRWFHFRGTVEREYKKQKKLSKKADFSPYCHMGRSRNTLKIKKLKFSPTLEITGG
jgi:hypothetical protein